MFTDNTFILLHCAELVLGMLSRCSNHASLSIFKFCEAAAFQHMNMPLLKVALLLIF